MKKKEMKPLTEEEEKKMHNKQKVCHMCKKRFTIDNEKLKDYCMIQENIEELLTAFVI